MMVVLDTKVIISAPLSSQGAPAEIIRRWEAAYLVSGDEHLLDLKAYQGVVILNPRGFLAVLDVAR